MNATARCFSVALLAAVAFWSSPALSQGTPLISGTVRDRATNAALANVRVVAGHVELGVFGFDLILHGETITDASGVYAITQLDSTSPNGRYVVLAGGGDFVRVVHPDQICRFACYVTTSTPTHIIPSNDVDFLTRPAGKIAGQVLRASDGSPVQTFVEIRRAGAQNDSITRSTDASGLFSIDGLVEEEYWIFAGTTSATGGSNGTDLVRQVFPAVELDFTRDLDQLVGSGIASPTPVAAGQTVDAEFALAPGACIEGRRTSTVDNAPLDNLLTVKRVDPAGNPAFVSPPYTATEGALYRINGLIPGAARVRFTVGDQFQPNFYPDAANEADAASVPLVRGQCTRDVDAHLVPRQFVRGVVRDSGTGFGAPGVPVTAGIFLAGPFGGLSVLSTTVTDASGGYVLQGLSPSSSRLVWTDDYRGLFRQAYFLRPPFTPVTSWDSISLPQDQGVNGIDFSLQRGFFASGRVLDDGPEYYHTIYFSNVQSGALNYAGRPDFLDGRYATSPFMPASYRLVLQPASTNIYYVYPGLPCTGTGAGTGIALCDVPGATVFTFDETREYPNLDFDLVDIDTLMRDGFE